MPVIALRRPSRADGLALIRAHLQSRDYHQPWVEPFTDQAGFDAWFAEKTTGPHASFLAVDVESGEIAGVVNISQIVTGVFQSAYLGFYGMAGFGGRGLMTDALRQVIAYAFNDLGLHRLEANIQPSNARSLALVKRLGFQKEGFSPRYLKIDGEWRDHERWAILVDAA